jgi:hypothetical protein
MDCRNKAHQPWLADSLISGSRHKDFSLTNGHFLIEPLFERKVARQPPNSDRLVGYSTFEK